jgi:hypothetical protein
MPNLVDLLGQVSLFAKLTLAAAIVGFGLPVAYVFRPTEQKLVLMRPVSLAGIFATVSGMLGGWIAVLGSIPATPDGHLPACYDVNFFILNCRSANSLNTGQLGASVCGTGVVVEREVAAVRPVSITASAPNVEEEGRRCQRSPVDSSHRHLDEPLHIVGRFHVEALR